MSWRRRQVERERRRLPLPLPCDAEVTRIVPYQTAAELAAADPERVYRATVEARRLRVRGAL